MTTQESELGTLEWVNDLRDAWKHEAHNFTPWLTRNLDRLSAVLGIELELEGSEVYVGPYRADIVATDGVGALIQRGGRAVAGMLTIATAGGS